MISNIVGLAAGLEISKMLGAKTAPGPGQANWIAAAYPLTQGTFVLVSGRLGAVYGHKNVLLWGGAWFVVWSVVNGFVGQVRGCDFFCFSFVLLRSWYYWLVSQSVKLYSSLLLSASISLQESKQKKSTAQQSKENNKTD